LRNETLRGITVLPNKLRSYLPDDERLSLAIPYNTSPATRAAMPANRIIVLMGRSVVVRV
jgi:hypothetical protein